MTKIKLCLILCFISFHSSAQVETINDSFGSLPNLLIAATGSAKDQKELNNFDLGNYNKKTCEQEFVPRVKSELIPSREVRPYISLKDSDYKFEAALVLSYGSNFQFIKKELENQDGSYQVLGSELTDLISKDFNSFSDREKAMQELCKGKSEKERLALVSQLSKNLSEIYDYERSGGGPNSGTVVSSEMQWNALNQKSKGVSAAVGVCRDAVSTVSHFAQNCGFSKDQIRMESIKTQGAGHVVTVIRGSDGKNYNINWTEFFSTDATAVGADPILNVTNVNAGVTISSYDADGNLRSTRLTEVGAILAANAGGDVSDLNYLPNFNQMRLAAKKIALNVFDGKTDAGDEIKGAGIVSNEVEGMIMGLSMANNKRFLRTLSDGTKVELEQKMLFLSIEGDILNNSDFTLVSKSGGEFKINPSVETDVKFGYYINQINDGNKKSNAEGRIILSPGGDISYYDPKEGITVSFGGNSNFMMGSYSTINERGTPGEVGESSALPTFTGYQLNGSARMDVTENATVGVYSERQSDYFSSAKSYGVDLFNKDDNNYSKVSVGYTTLKDGRGEFQTQDRLVTFSSEESRNDGRWRLSVDGMVEPVAREFRIMSGVTYRFK